MARAFRSGFIQDRPEGFYFVTLTAGGETDGLEWDRDICGHSPGECSGYKGCIQRFRKIVTLMDTGKAELLAFTTFPRSHWVKIWSTNPLERINKEIKRRSRVVGIFPNEAGVIRLVGAVLADMHDEWQAGDRRNLSDTSMTELYPTRNNGVVTELEPGD